MERGIEVIGGGIAGLAVATALAQRGAAVVVRERAPAITDVGAGIQISPNGAVVLEALGLGGDLVRVGQRAGGVVLRNATTGARIMRLDLGALRPGQDYFFVHRADLIGLLADAARAAGVDIRLSQDVVSLEPDASGGPKLTDRTGATEQAGLVIGADGLNSTVRAALDRPAEPFFTHQVAWRAVIPDTPGGAAEAQVFMGPGRHLVSYPLRGGTMRNIVAVEERHSWAAEGWHHRDDPDNLRAAFAGFAAPVADWLARVQEAHLWGLYRHPVAGTWYHAGDDGAVAILGDAAHPTLPFLAQGANMALEDAWTLAAALADTLNGRAPVAASLAAWQGARAPRARRIVEAANRNARIYHLTGPARLVAQTCLRLGALIAPGAALRRFDWLYGHDVTAGT